MLSHRFNSFLVLLCLLFLFGQNIKAQQFKNEEELKKEAGRLFEEDEFTKAYSLYAQLVSNYPKDPEYNYRLGVCMLYSEADKTKCFSYLKFAAGHPKDAPKDAKFYLGKAYHINYLFDEAIKNYEEYKKIGTPNQVKKLQVDKEIRACQNGKRLLSSMSDLVVMNKKQLNEADYFRSYDLSSIGGKLLVKPDVFKTSIDKKKKDKSVVFVPKTGEKVFFSSYGEKGENGRDIYFANRLPNNDFGTPVRVVGINTEFDEDYPFLHPDGKTLYFSSKGFNSMGGYDIFKTTYNPETDSWSLPVNLEFPINSPDDDYLFVTDSSEKIAYFSTGRQSPPGKIDVLKVNTERRPMEIAVIKGTVLKENSAQSLKSKITVKNLDNGQITGVYYAQDNGDYYMELPNGGKFIFTIETPGIPTQSDKVALPMATSLKPFKQSISYDQKVLKILNYFDSPPDDNSYLQYLSLIEKKAKLDVNEGQLKTPTIVSEENNNAVATNTTASAVNTTNPTIVSEEGPTNPSNTTATKNNTAGMTNAQLVDIAKQDAKEAAEEAKKMNQDARDAFEIADQKNSEATRLQKEADDAMAGLTAITDEVKKKEAETKAIEIKRDADNATAIASTILNLAKNLEADAKVKEREAELNNQYATELESVTKNPNNKEALGKLNDLQKQVEEIAAQKKKSDEVYSTIKSENDQKQAKITSLEEKSSQLRNEIDGIKKEIALNENEIGNTKDKSLKTNLTNQNKELNTDLAAKSTALDQNEQELNKVKAEAKAIQNELDLVNTIKTTDSPTAIAQNNSSSNTETNTSAISNTNNSSGNNPSTNSTALNLENVSTRYDSKILAITNTNDKAGLEETNKILIDYNKEINDLIALEKVDLTSASTAAEKKRINDEIKKLENQKKTNTDKIASNNQKIKQLNGDVTSANTNTTSTATNNTSVNNSTPNTNSSSPSIAFDGKDDLNKLDELKSSTDNNVNATFAFSAYKEPSSVSMKKDADDKLQLVNASKNDLDVAIGKAKEEVKNAAPITSDKARDKLNEQGDEIASKAKDLRIAAQDKTGEEKEKLLNDARELDKQANKKYLEATDVTKTANDNEFSANTDNITTLLATNASAKEDLKEAQKLAEEAKTGFKQAQSIREEAKSQPGDAAKLGIVSNAEEKEAEALNKQRKAVELLAKANPNVALKTPDNTIKSGAATENLTKVTQQFEKLNKDKIDAYLAFSKANQNEIKLQSAQLGQNPALKNNSEASGYKKQADDLNAEAKALIGKALTEANNNAKQNLLMEANKKEVDAVTALNKASELLQSGTSVAVNTNTSEPKSNNTETNTNNSTTSNSTGNDSGTNTTKANEIASNQGTNTNNSDASSNTEKNNASNEGTRTNSSEGNTNTAINNSATSDQANTNIASTNTNVAPGAYKNPEANTLKSNASVAIKNLEEEQAKLDQEIKSAPATTRTETEVKNSITALESEADTYSKEARDKRTEAADKPEEEKQKLMAEAKSLDRKAMKVKLDAANIQKDLNDAQSKTYNDGITSLLEKAKTAGAPELNQAQELIDIINNYKKQASNIREESASLPTDAAKLGGYSNAEEKELEMFNKQLDVIGLLRKYDPEFVIKEPTVTVANTADNASPELKQKYDELVQKQVTEYNNISKANALEYETVSAQLPANLDPQQKATKENADKLMNEAKDLTARASQSTDNKQKKDLLVEAGKKGQDAVTALNTITASTAVAKNTTPRTNRTNNTGGNTNAGTNENRGGNNTVATNNNPPRNNRNNTNATNTNAGNNAAGTNLVAIKANGVEVKTTNAYNASNPIPIDQKIPDGLVFRVQIGAFKTPVANDAFKGLAPVNGQTTPNGYIRYTAGNFEKFEDANAVKNDLNNLGYKDAFVVGYYNGKRVSLSEIADILSKEGKPVDLAANTNQSAGITENANIPRNTAPVAVNNDANANPVVVTKELEQINGMLFTIQIGVYTKQISKARLYNLSPIYTEKLPSGLYRYTAGIYNQKQMLMDHRQKVADIGIKDAFMSAYYNGKKITFADAEKLRTDSANLKMEPENPIVFPTSLPTGNVTPANPANNVSTGNVAPFSNGVSTAPEPTAENGVKAGEAGLTFKVQIGAYRNQVPNETAAKFLNIKTWPIASKQINGLYIYTVGSFVDAKSAKRLKDEMVALGITDAYVTVYRDGTKLYGTEAAGLLNR